MSISSNDNIMKDIEDIEGNETIVSFAGLMMKLNSEEDVEPIIDAINGCQRLVTLSLEGNTLGITAAKGLAKSLESHSCLENILFNNLFTGRLKTEIPEALLFLTSGVILSNARLNTLDLSDNAIGPVGMPSLLPFLQSDCCQSLQTLRLNNCGLGVGGGQILAKGLVALKCLKTLICGRNRLEITGSQAIGKALAELNTLETLEMPQNGIHSTGIETICEAIQSNKGLKNLNLNDNNLKTEAKTIASALKGLDSIQTINFGDCILRRSGCVAICEALIESNVSDIKEINLSGNEIGGEEAIETLIDCSLKLAQICGQSLKVRLDLSNNNFGESGVERLTNALGQRFDLIISDDEGSDEEADERLVDKSDDNEEDLSKDETIGVTSEVKDNSENIEELTKKIGNELKDINDLCSHFVQISINGFNGQTSQLRDEALIESEICLKSAINQNPNQYIAINTLLVNLGLLKDETGVYRTVDDLRGPLSALTHSIGHLSLQQKQVLRAFMNRPNSSVERCGKIKHSLMQQLFC